MESGNKLNRSNKIGFTCGAFDLCHAGHCLMFKECSEQCDWLIVGLQTNPQVDRPDKHKPIMSLFERYRILKSNKFIDEVIVYETEADLVNFLRDINPDVRFVGADWIDKEFTGKGLCPVIYNSRNHNFSTTELRQRIKQS
jgi:glycerol-3-phosphate cytidylyltransferase